jgi:putative ABC transport system permease protein
MVLASLIRDIQFAIRLVRRTPVVSAVALLSVALGMGANVAVFSLMNALMLKALPIHQPERLVVLTQPVANPSLPPVTTFPYPQWEFLRDQQDVFAGVLATGNARFDLNAGGQLRPVSGLYVTGRFFDVLGVTPQVGRLFTDADDVRGGGADGPVAVLSDGFWRREYGGDPDVAGRQITLDGHAFTIIGVAAKHFFGVTVGRTFDVAVPFGTEPIIRGAESGLDRRSMWWVTLMARLAPGQTIAQAETRLDALRPAMREATMPQQFRPQDQAQYLSSPLGLVPAATGISALRDRYSRPLAILLGMVALVLLIACANMANLLLAQSTARQKELAVRLSLGASRWQVARQLLVESLLLASIGTACGLLLALWGSRALLHLLSTRTSVVALDLGLDWRVLSFTVAVTIGTAVLFGAVPALRAMHLTPAGALRDTARGVIGGSGRMGWGYTLLALQVAISFLLVLGAGVFVRTLVDLTTADVGFEHERVLIASVDLRRTGLTDTARPAMFERLREAAMAVPGIEAAAVSVVTPISGMVENNLVSVPGYAGPERDPSSLVNRVTPDYFRTMATPILAGRDLQVSDHAGSPRVVMVNEAFARTFFAGVNPVGRTFTIGTPGRPGSSEVEIVGLVADAKYRTLREPPQPTMYPAWSQEDAVASSARISMRVQQPTATVRAAVLHALQNVHEAVVVDFRTLQEELHGSLVQERLVASVSAFFGGLALLLAAIGLYGMLSYTVARRRNEIGVRMALGAEPARVIREVLGGVAAVVVIGLAAGATAAAGLARFVNALLHNLVATDLTMISMAGLALAITAAAAGFLPARRAAAMDPMVALREE